ncbi:DUF1127 domain-containing protein [Fertoeibacter niger]|uniref:DUF1127 domain-containing protein n=1 Tax=Fertoeibacter niger TaxID=2656921 RepID=UPI001F4CBF62|nr:DUF1127 domain-containing protein [Fertoeibacter niger]
MTSLAAHHPLPPFARVAFNVALVILAWEERRQSRRHLARLDKHMLRDIGMTLREAEDEVAKPFWRG